MYDEGRIAARVGSWAMPCKIPCECCYRVDKVMWSRLLAFVDVTERLLDGECTMMEHDDAVKALFEEGP